MNKTITLTEDRDIVYSSFELHKNGITPIGTPTFEQWQEVGKFIQRSGSAVHFWIGDWLNYGEQKWGEMYAQAIEETGYDEGTLKNDKWVSSRIELSRRHDNLSFSRHQEVAKLEPEKQDELLTLSEEKNLRSKELRKIVKEYQQKKLPALQLPEGLYDVIYADPPWKYDFSETDSRKIENQYQTMEVEEIKVIPIPAHTPDNAVLFLWATAPKLREALEVMEAWGFTYKTHMIWDKEIIGMGYWFRGQHELLLVGTKGSLSPPEESLRISSIYREKRMGHSKKPNYFYDMIEQWYPNGKYLELFARQKRNNKWRVFGNQV